MGYRTILLSLLCWGGVMLNSAPAQEAGDLVRLRKAGVGDEVLALIVKEKVIPTQALTVEEIIQLKQGGMNLFQLPFTQDRQRATACYGNVAVLTLLRMLRGHGSRDKHLEAQIVGGAQAPHTGKSDVGRENCRVARTLLVKAGIPIISEDTGGRRGRKVVFRTDTGELMVIKVTHLRKGDWYPYAAER